LRRGPREGAIARRYEELVLKEGLSPQEARIRVIEETVERVTKKLEE
jgi:hypothetical protein